jgi:mannose-6-phosphate isomerase class I
VDLVRMRQDFVTYLGEYTLIHIDDYAKSIGEIQSKMFPYLGHDRVFGRMCPFRIDEFYDENVINGLKQQIDALKRVIIYGFGASLIDDHDMLFYVDLPRWTIQERHRTQGLQNWKSGVVEDDALKKFKYGYFVEWRMADRLKESLWNTIDYYIDAVSPDEPKCVMKRDMDRALRRFATEPFRLVPHFDQGVWGGRWMEEVCDLEASEDNYAWCFDGVPEETSLYIRFDNARIETPAINLVLFESRSLLGDRIIRQFGKEFPIRFDMLDTMGGQNLSLQVHPTTEYIRKHFGMSYTQDESYYILDATDDSSVYMGVKEHVTKDSLVRELENAQTTNHFNHESFINRFPVKKHDHISIPNGTIHCSGKNTMVLEISATPYIFTFKLWDWDRLGLDGLPRPIHINHGRHVIDMGRDTAFVANELLNRAEVIQKHEDWMEERTGLHPSEFIETRRHTFKGQVIHHTQWNMNVLNLVEGSEVVVESPTKVFEPFVVHYAETFIIPAEVGSYVIRPLNDDHKTYKTIKAYVRDMEVLE